jgi:hypothetical protein
MNEGTAKPNGALELKVIRAPIEPAPYVAPMNDGYGRDDRSWLYRCWKWIRR